ncbi:C40 family peptidase [Nonomuraea rhizosphaerae]|uniref:C40 family peptidase n=1 Tax=Nonomuraea rhizosphaerae TaxID=2665663 RepID=UPI0027E2EA4B|nr:NlpC/P60 family protein [Nonomuraea rhizosphaerae]
MPTRLGRTAVATSLSFLVLASVTPAAVAEPTPSPAARAKVQAKLVKLNEQADKVVERYNQATETYKRAKKKYDALDAELTVKSVRSDTLRKDIVAVAINDYQYGSFGGVQPQMIQGGPQASLASMASLAQMAADRASKLRVYEDSIKDLRDRRNDAKTALAEADKARDQVGDDKKDVEKLIAEQTRLLRRLGTFKSGNPNSTGIKYSGPASGDARTALEFAFAQVGKPYRYGGTGPNFFDCSGFTQAAWRAAGVSLPRTTYTQWAWGASRRVPLNQLEPGDLLFSRGLGHMGMYVGNGRMVHAPQTGDVVKVVNLDDYWRARLLGAIRP